MIYAVKDKPECPTCKQKGCFAHCNNCGNDIKWNNYLGDPYYETNKSGKRSRYAYNKDDSVHKCLKKGQNFVKDANLINEWKIDEYRSLVRYGGPTFRCTLCGRRADLPWLKQYHPKDPQCLAKLTAMFFKEPASRVIDINNESLDDY